VILYVPAAAYVFVSEIDDAELFTFVLVVFPQDTDKLVAVLTTITNVSLTPVVTTSTVNGTAAVDVFAVAAPMNAAVFPNPCPKADRLNSMNIKIVLI